MLREHPAPRPPERAGPAQPVRGARGARANGRGRDLSGEGFSRGPPRTLRHPSPRHHPRQDGRQETTSIHFADTGLNT